ncbi:MAG: Cache 3/Cache 2 fusion domain-containing protein [Gallicola sp.]|nr:Cache 3/Cache 2 fusion domain-containing protein [Gallicola sp.]
MKGNFKKLVSYIGMIALIASLIVGLLGYTSTNRQIEEIKNHLLTNHVKNNITLTKKYMDANYGGLTLGKGTLLDKDGNSIEDDTKFVDSVMEDLGDQVTVFVREKEDFRRISTNIMNEDNRATGTYLGTDHNAYKTVMKGEIYIGEADVLGDNYYTAYEPLKDENENVIGILFIGIPMDYLDNILGVHYREMGRINGIVFGLRAIALASLIVLVSMSVIEQRRPKLKEDAFKKPEDPLE